MLFSYGTLPEIVGKWYTRKHVTDNNGVVQPLTVYRYAVHLKINGTACHVPKVHASKKCKR